MPRLCLLAALAAVCFAGRPAAAAPTLNITPGLWTGTLSFSDPQAIMPPTVRAQMPPQVLQTIIENLQKPRQICITRDKIADGLSSITRASQNRNCQHRLISVTTNKVEFEDVCTVIGTLHTTITATDPQSFHTDVQVRDPNTTRFHPYVRMEGKWMADQCGDVK